MNHSTLIYRTRLLCSAAVLMMLSVVNLNAIAQVNEPDITHLSTEQLITNYTFFGGDSLTLFNFERAYDKALHVENIDMAIELRNFFYIEESKFVKSKYNITELPSEHNRTVDPPIQITSTCNNTDFEDGNWTGWTGAYGYNTNSNGNLTLTGFTINNGALNNTVSNCHFHTLIGPGYPNDPYGNFPGVDPGGGNYAARLGGDWINLANYQCANATSSLYSSGELIQQSFVVTAANALITYDYAVVFGLAPHNNGEQPYFHAQVFDSAGHSISACLEYFVQDSNGVPPPGFITRPNCHYLPWTQNSINLTSYLGQTVTVKFIASGCIYGGHWGYAYVDVNCSPVEIVVSSGNLGCGGTATLTAPPSAGGTYTWSGPGIVGSNTGQSVTVNAAGNYTVTVHPATGCDYVLSTSVVASPGLNVLATNTNLRCNGSSTGLAIANTVAPNIGTPPYTYAWNTVPVQTGQTATGLAAGTYTVTITDQNGCTSSTAVTVTQPSALAANATHLNESCYGGNTATATVNSNGGIGPYTYLWSTTPPYQQGQTATGLVATSYNVRVTDANGCTITVWTTITQPPSLTAVTALANVSCHGGNNGSINVTANGGTGAYTYAWSTTPVQTSATASNLTVGVYTVTITDANGCTKVQTAAISEPTALNAGNAGVTNILCSGGNNGSAIVSANGGVAPYTYAWNTAPVQTGITATGLIASDYTCTVTDAHGCTKLQPFSITQPTPLLASIPNHVNVNCNGQNNGSAISSVSGGTTPYTYLWSPVGGTGATANNLPANTYTVSVTDAHGCTQVSNVTITEPTPLASVTGLTNVNCYGQNNGSAYATPAGGSTPYTYSWSPSGGTGATASNLTAGNYTVRVTDSHGCTLTSMMIITQPTVVTAVASPPTNVSCFGLNDGSAFVTPGGGTLPYTYAWSPVGGTGATANNLLANAYTVTVTDSHGCSQIDTVTIAQPPILTANTGLTNVNCFGQNNGSAYVTAGGGTTPYSYLWSPAGGTNATANSILAGNYTVTVTDAHGCVQTSTAVVNQPSLLTASTNPPVNVTCFGLSNGSASVAAGGGSPTYSYLWTPIGGTNATANNLPANTYTVIVTDSHGCTQIDTVTITQPVILASAITAHTDILCYGGNNGDATVTPNGGSGAYTYVWNTSPVQFGAIANNLAAGTYSVIVSDMNGCTTTTAVVITQPPILTALPSNTNVSCFGVSDATASVIAGGGTAPYTYLWTPVGGNNAIANGLPAGPYTVSVTDANGCLQTATATVTEPPLLVSTPSTPVNVICFGQNNGSLSVNVVGGTIPYTYAWSPAGGTSATANNLYAGMYTVTVSDAHGCTTVATPVVTEPTMLVSGMLPHTDNLCYGDQNGTAAVVAMGGSPAYTYQWSPVGGTNASVNSLTAGNYTVNITDSHGCTSTQSVVITQPSQLTLAVNTPPVICISQSAMISATAGGGTPAYTYTWDNGTTDSSQVVSPVVTTQYTVNVTDANGCTVAAQTIIVNVNPPLNIAASGPPALCDSSTANLTSLGGGGNGGPYTYTWDNGAITANTSILLTQDTTLNVTFSDGCSPPVQTSVSIIDNPNPIVNFAPQNAAGCMPFTADFTDSSITVPGSTYQWSLGDGTSSTSTNFSHTYPNPGVYSISLTVTTPANCVSTLSVPHVVEVYALPNANFSSTGEVDIDFPVVDFSNLSIDAAQWHWDFGDNSIDTLTYNPSHQYADTGYYNIQLAVVSPHGCVDTINGEIYVRPEWSIFIPNTFTPNGDGKNDGFSAYAVNILDYDMWILDRWGAKIYHSTDIYKQWDGTYFDNGNKCQSDVYVYKIKVHDIHGKEHIYIGHVTLWR